MPADIPAIPPPNGEGYKTTDYKMTCPACRKLVWAHYLVPAGQPGRAIIHAGPEHDERCEYWREDGK